MSETGSAESIFRYSEEEEAFIEEQLGDLDEVVRSFQPLRKLAELRARVSYFLANNVLPAKVFVEPAQSARMLRQHYSSNGLQSCGETSHINGLLWQGQISQEEAQKVHDQLLSYEARKFQTRMPNGSLMDSYSFEMIADDIVPHLNIKRFSFPSDNERDPEVVLTELARGNVMVVGDGTHANLAVGYKIVEDRTFVSTVDPMDPENMACRLMDPPHGYSYFSAVIPALDDPILYS